MRLGVSAYCFGRMIQKGEIQFMDIFPKAREIGYKVMEFIDLPTPEGMDIMDFAQKIADRCKENDIEITQYSPGADFLLGSGGDPWAESRRIKKQVDVAKVLGAYGVRHDHAWRFEDPRRKNWEDALAVIVEPIRDVAVYAASLGIKTMSENHGRMFQEGRRMEALVRAVNHENYGILVDIGNNVCVDADPLEGVCIMAPYCMHVHAKDFLVKPGNMTDPGPGWGRSSHGNFIRGTVIGHGMISMPQTFQILREANYDGVVSLEFEGVEDCLYAIQAGYTNLMHYMDKESDSERGIRGMK